jgi:hypothetical protein
LKPAVQVKSQDSMQLFAATPEQTRLAETTIAQLQAIDELGQAVYPMHQITKAASSNESARPQSASTNNHATNPATYESTSHAVGLMLATHQGIIDTHSVASLESADVARAQGRDATANSCNMLQIDPKEAERRLINILRKLISELLNYAYQDRDIERSMVRTVRYPSFVV